MTLAVKAQAVQITESRWWSGSRLCTTGEVQVYYRVFDNSGKVTKTGVLLRASGLERFRFKVLPEVSFPEKPPAEQSSANEVNEKRE